ncbi:MAG: hypothetical protein U1D31_00705 [Patescibacteria group bacterium]|nr:hypothetical protein [bacterium]MDZ4240642.1 hypothetical protein [Patescibacteria group bacterium]
MKNEEGQKEVHIIHCIPIARGIFRQHLSYFTTAEIPLGAVVKVPVRGRKMLALVVKKERASDLKTDIKRAAYVIKKIEKIETVSFFSKEFIESCEEAAHYFATTTGQVVSALVPKTILEHMSRVSRPLQEGKTPITGERFILQSGAEDRFANYKSLVREEFARGSSVFFCLPTIEDIKKAKNILEKGIEPYTLSIHTSMGTKELIKMWNAIVSEPHPVLIIATGTFLSIPRGDISTIVIERENSRSYKTQKRPIMDIRVFARLFAKLSGKRLILGDTLLRVETIFDYKNNEYLEIAHPKFRSVLHEHTEVISMKSKAVKGKFEIISDELAELIEKTKKNNERLFLFSVRKGIAPSIVCGDCGATVVSEQCGAPMILKRGERENVFFCPVCKEERSAKEICKQCGSWKLQALGVGIERIEEEIKERFPSVKLFRIDKDKTSTYKKAKEVSEKFENTPSSILLGTEMALLYLSGVENAAVVSMDSLFSVPDFRINEKILYILLTMRDLVTKQFLIQTRNPQQLILDYAVKGNLIDFYRDEITIRKHLGYPPFSIIVKMSVRGRKNSVESMMKKMEAIFADKSPDVVSVFSPAPEKSYGLNMIMKIPRDKWPDEDILSKIRSLGPAIAVEVDPESILN